jgi:hypothetical protein
VALHVGTHHAKTHVTGLAVLETLDDGVNGRLPGATLLMPASRLKLLAAGSCG